MENDLKLTVSEFVGLLNQTLEFAYPSVTIVGELSNLRVSKGRWVYFDLKDDNSSVKFFGTVYQLPGPLEDGMMLQVRGTPKLHNLFGFSVNVSAIMPVGEGSLKKAADLLMAKLQAEGLFDPERKRTLPYPPKTIGLITSGESAAYHDFVKIIDQRWCGLAIHLADVQVQGEPAVGQIVSAIEYFNGLAEMPDVLVVTRGGGSADDLAAFSTEQVTRAVAASRIPTIVAIGHEVDVSLAELAADQRASTPSNAAELLVPDKQTVKDRTIQYRDRLYELVDELAIERREVLQDTKVELSELISGKLDEANRRLKDTSQLLAVLSPQAVFERGFAAVRSGGAVVRSAGQLGAGDGIEIQFSDGKVKAKVES